MSIQTSTIYFAKPYKGTHAHKYIIVHENKFVFEGTSQMQIIEDKQQKKSGSEREKRKRKQKKDMKMRKSKRNQLHSISLEANANGTKLYHVIILLVVFLSILSTIFHAQIPQI